LNLVKILAKRGDKFPPRNLAETYEDMISRWATLMNFSILTQHINPRLKAFDDDIQKYIKNLN
jgi:hypothetical protein